MAKATLWLHGDMKRASIRGDAEKTVAPFAIGARGRRDIPTVNPNSRRDGDS